MSSNFRPSIRSTDWGTWRRVKLIPWEVVVPKERRDEQLKAKLRTEASGILNWMLRGLADYLKNGMQYPQKVKRHIDPPPVLRETEPLGRNP